jgi:hypothetical protein
MTLPRHFRRPPEDALPAAAVRFMDLRVEPYADGRRLRVYIDLPPCQQPPNLELLLTAANGDNLGLTHIIECVEEKLTLTLHIRSSQPVVEAYTLLGTIQYDDLGIVDSRSLTIEPPSGVSE